MRIKLFILFLFSLMHYDAMCQFFKPYCYENSTVIYTQGSRPMCDRKFEIILYELNLVASQTNSDIEFTYSGIDTTTVLSTTYTMLLRTNKTTYLDTSYKYIRADFTGNLKASFEVWFNELLHYSDSVRITFSSKEQFNEQNDSLLANPFYSHISNDTLILNTSKFWQKTGGQKKRFGREFLVLNSEKKEIKIFRKYFIRKDYKELMKNIK